MRVRESDFTELDGKRQSGVRIERTIPLWGIILLAVTIAGQALMLWNTQEKQVLQLTMQAGQMEKMAQTLDTLNTRQNTKDTKDMEQDLRLSEVNRRTTLIESHLQNTGARNLR